MSKWMDVVMVVLGVLILIVAGIILSDAYGQDKWRVQRLESDSWRTVVEYETANTVPEPDPEPEPDPDPMPDPEPPAGMTLEDFGEYLCTGPDGFPKCQKITDYSGMVYDEKRHRMLMFGGGHSATFTDTIAALDLETMEWSMLYPWTPCSSMTIENIDYVNGAWFDGPAGPYPRPISRHTYDLQAVVGDELILITGVHPGSSTCARDSVKYISGRVAHYDLNADLWSFTDVHPGYRGTGATSHSGSAVDPVTETVLIFGRYGAFIYDPRAGTKTQIEATRRSIAIESSLVYSEIDDTFYFFTNESNPYHQPVIVYRVTPVRSQGALSAVQVELIQTTGAPATNRRGYAYNSTTDRIGGGASNGMLYEFDPIRAQWIAYEMPVSVAFHALGYDPLAQAYIFLGADRHTWRFRPGVE